MRIVTLIITGFLLVAPAAQAAPTAPFTLFPVVGGANYTDDFGDSRGGNSSHEGNDLLAACGTPTVAVVSGTVSLDYGDRSGWMLTLTGKNSWYRYIHMDGRSRQKSAFAKGLRDGSRVKEGQVVAYVGNSGDASGGGCHLHFELHSGQRVTSPYRWLQQATVLQPDPADPASNAVSTAVSLTITGTLIWAASGPTEGRLMLRPKTVITSNNTKLTCSRPIALRIAPAAIGSLRAGDNVTVTTLPEEPTEARLKMKPLEWTVATATRRS